MLRLEGPRTCISEVQGIAAHRPTGLDFGNFLSAKRLDMDSKGTRGAKDRGAERVRERERATHTQTRAAEATQDTERHRKDRRERGRLMRIRNRRRWAMVGILKLLSVTIE